MATGEIQISALPQASLPISLSDIFHLKQGIVDKRCTLDQLLFPHTSLQNNPHNVTKQQVQLGFVENALQLIASMNLSDIPDKVLARANLGVISSAEVNTLINNHINDKNNPHQVTKQQVLLGNVQNWTYSNLYTEAADKYATARAVKALHDAIVAQYPVGSIHISVNPANPATYLLCGGTWVQESKGRALVGFNDSSRAVGTNFGSSTVTLSQANLPAHTHSISLTGGDHTHSASTIVNNFDYGTKTTNTFDYGTKTVSTFNHGNKNTTTNGAHTHTRGSMEITGGFAVDDSVIDSNYKPQGSFFTDGARNNYDARSTLDGNGWNLKFAASRTWSGATSTSGDHAHTVNIGSHNHTVAIGAHSHTVQIGSHSHSATTTVQSSGHTHTGTSGSVGSGQAVNIEQPSYVVYVWRRTA